MIIETSEHKLCELVLIELFSRVGIAYKQRRGDEIQKVERGEIDIPICVYSEIEAYLHKSHCESPYYKELLNELIDMKTRFESKSVKIYNRDFKNSFLLNYSNNHETVRVTRELFKHTYKFEDELKKDLYDFTFEEAEKVLSSLSAGTIESLQNLKSKISRYLDFSIEQGVSSIGINYYKTLRKKADLDKYLDKEKELTSEFDRDEIISMAMGADNAQDGVILGLLFDGVSHKNEFEELINLSIHDIHNIDEVDRSMTLRSVNKEGVTIEKTIPISYETAVLVKVALDQDVKYKSIDEEGKSVRQHKIAEGDNVLRGLRGQECSFTWTYKTEASPYSRYQ